jgi:hypothetical protein
VHPPPTHGLIAWTAWLESTAFSIWMRESPSVFAFPIILSFHTIGMGLVAGINGAVALRILGVGSSVPVGEMKRFLPIMWFGFWLNAVSGVALLIGYPTKALTNPLFYLKLGLVAAALVVVGFVNREVLDRYGDRSAADIPLTVRAKQLAVATLVCWAGAITAGRLLAYTYRHLMADM